ncbi:hypothetical protein A4H97_31955 [Niastella yeongjuensis]|uniref:Transferase n=1 Tax=Niastella yeongjuensis TaxID=354355 RepID=A0A1V9EI98_9BACT|nr:carbamoyltransferase C-terminal domain-containing protein [Niastella yeongjuensis]OQP45860.1 hypothetical protein A4H97_31955 [Niastella yeongjuensis]SEP46671.1 Carbamoyltransferase N-terminus [Niastella yeongjuensis]
MKKPVYVLGTGTSHDGSACLLKDGVIAVAIEKERITRRKHDGWNDNDAIQYCLDAEGIKMEDVDLIVEAGMNYIFHGGYTPYETKVGKRLIELYRQTIPVVTISHHLAHAYSAIGTAPFDEMAILVIDGCGNSMSECMDLDGACVPDQIPGEWQHLLWEKDSFYEYRNNKLQPLFKDFSPRSRFFNYVFLPDVLKHSIGSLYEAASMYCLGDQNATGKLMGLAPYGRQGVYDQEIFDCRDGRFFVNYHWQKSFKQPFRNYNQFKSDFQYYADIAYWVQKETERAILYLVNERARLTSSRNLAYTGGVALNAVANARILQNSPFEQLYMTPAAGDNGLSIGCAFFGWMEVLKKERIKFDGNSCFGRIYPDADIVQAIENYQDHTNVNIPEVVDTFFSNLAQYSREDAAELAFALQFIIKGCGVYLVEQKKGEPIQLSNKMIAGVNGTVIIDGRDFMQWMLNFNLTHDLIGSGRLQAEGDIAGLRYIFDSAKMRETMEEAIRLHNGNVRKPIYTYEPDVVGTTARLLAEGKVIGWFQEGSEFGPRALGHRSILADPGRKDIQQFINSKVKFREDFRPFAPSVLLQDVSTYFRYEGESPYMIMVAQVQPDWKDRIPGVVHKDNSCRIQTVTPQWNKRYYELLTAFKKETGVGVLLNTSFNRKNMPIVETPEHALRFFFECDLDCLVMGDYIVYKN